MNPTPDGSIRRDDHTLPPPPARAAGSRVLVVGWDGADWAVLRPLLAEGILPNLSRLVARGTYGDCLSTVPSHSWCAWPSFMTGLGPAGHGVYDVLEHKPGATRRYPVTYESIRARTIFDDLTDAGKTTLALNIPLTFPPPRIKGKVVAGGVLPAGRSYTHPSTLQQELDSRAPWPVNGMSWTTFRNRPEEFLDEVQEITTRRQQAFEYMLDGHEWDLAVVVYVSTDRVQHCLMQYLSPDHPDHAELRGSRVGERVRDLYRQLDEGLGRLLERTTADDLVIFMSDHGHQPCTRACTVDGILHELGYLEPGRGSGLVSLVRWGPGRRIARRVYDVLKLHGRVALPASPVDWSRTLAYTSVVSTGEGVSVNLRGREPGGIVAKGDYEAVRDEVAAALAEFEDAGHGRRPILKVYRKEELLSGPHLDAAPDLLLVPAPSYSLTHARAPVEDADWVSGDHRLEGVVVAVGPKVAPGPVAETVRLVDLGPTCLAALGVASSVPRDGEVVSSFVGDARLRVAARFDDVARDTVDGGEDGAGLTSGEQGEIEDHLRGLGYVE